MMMMPAIHCCTSSTDKPQHWLGLCSVQRLTLESWYTNPEQTPLNRCPQLPASSKRLIQDGNETDKRASNRPAMQGPTPTKLTNNRRIETHQWLITNFTRVFQPIPSWLNWPITFNGEDLLHNRLTNTICLTLKMTSAQVVETSVTNNSSF